MHVTIGRARVTRMTPLGGVTHPGTILQSGPRELTASGGLARFLVAMLSILVFSATTSAQTPPKAAKELALPKDAPAASATAKNPRTSGEEATDYSRQLEELKRQLELANRRAKDATAAATAAQQAAKDADARAAKAEASENRASKQWAIDKAALGKALAALEEANQRATQAQSAESAAQKLAAQYRDEARIADASRDAAEQSAKKAEDGRSEAAEQVAKAQSEAEAARAERDQMKVERDGAVAEKDRLSGMAAALRTQEQQAAAQLEERLLKWGAAAAGLALILGSGLGLGIGRLVFKPAEAATNASSVSAASPVSVAVRVQPELAATRIEGAALDGPTLRVAARLMSGATEYTVLDGGSP